jgi:hypothetical protein
MFTFARRMLAVPDVPLSSTAPFRSTPTPAPTPMRLPPRRFPPRRRGLRPRDDRWRKVAAPPGPKHALGCRVGELRSADPLRRVPRIAPHAQRSWSLVGARAHLPGPRDRHRGPAEPASESQKECSSNDGSVNARSAGRPSPFVFQRFQRSLVSSRVTSCHVRLGRHSGRSFATPPRGRMCAVARGLHWDSPCKRAFTLRRFVASFVVS